MADDGIVFDGTTPERRRWAAPRRRSWRSPRRSPRAAIACSVRNRCAAPLAHNGVDWAPLADGTARARRSLHRQSRPSPDRPGAAARRACSGFTIPAAICAKPRYVWALLRHRPVIVTIGAYHAATVPWWMPSGGRAVIPYGIADAVPRTPRRRVRRRRRARSSPRTRCAASIGCSICGSGASIRRCPRPSCISIAGPRSMATRRRRQGGGDGGGAGARRRARGEGRAPPRAAAARATDRGARSGARDALSRRRGRDLLPRRRRGAGAGRAGGGAGRGRAGRARRRRRHRHRRRATTSASPRRRSPCSPTTRCGGAQHEAALARQRGSSWDEVGAALRGA